MKRTTFAPVAVSLMSLAASAAASPVHALPTVCTDVPVTVETGTDAEAALICRAAATAFDLFEECAISPPEPLSISIVEDLGGNCYGIFHCGEARIELVSPEEMVRIRKPDSVYAALAPERLFESIVVHEIAHAAYDTVPCPNPGSCYLTSEYFAYTVQALSLAPEERAGLEAKTRLDRTVSPESINPILAAMAPGLFASRAWAHANQTGDVCGMLGSIASGEIVFEMVEP